MRTTAVHQPLKGNERKISPFEKYVVDVVTARELHKIGYRAETMFYWIDNTQLETTTLYQAGADYYGPLECKIPAPTAAEVRDALPSEIWVTIRRSMKRCKGLFVFSKFNGVFSVSLMVKSDDTNQMYEFHREESQNEATATAQMVIYIRENDMEIG